MRFIGNLGIRQKIWCLVIPALFFIVSIGTVGYLGLASSVKEIDGSYYQVYLPTTYVDAVNALNYKLRSDMLEMMISSDEDKKKELTTSIEQTKNEMSKNLALYEKTDIDPEESVILKSLKEKLVNNQTVTRDIMALAAANQTNQSYTMYKNEFGPNQDEIEKNLASLAAYNVKQGKIMVQNSRDDVALTGTIILILTLVSAVAGYIISRLVTKVIVPQLREMAAYLEKVAVGDLSIETMIASKNSKIYKDEVGNLADSIIKMRENLSKLISNVNDSAITIAASAEELSANAGESSKGIEEIANSVTMIATNTDTQLKTVTKSSGIVNDISANIAETVATTNDTSVAVKGTLEATVVGEKAINKAKDQMNQIKATVLDLEDVIGNLNTSSGQIGQIAGSISAIADQTNLLALNAAIEAARAGEQGRGFSVVADEVRKLAEQSQISSREITNIIVQIQKFTSNAVLAMKEGSDQVQIGLEVVDSAGDAFDNIATQVNGISEMMHAVTQDAHAIADGNVVLVETMSQVDQITNEVAEQTQNISANVEEQSAAMEEIASASESLAEIASNLQLEISKFKL